MTTPPKKPFNLHSKPQQDQLRDKDNADHKMPPPKLSHQPAPNLAPIGAGGIKLGLPSKGSVAKEPERLSFTLGEKGKLAKEFKPLSKHVKGHGHEH